MATSHRPLLTLLPLRRIAAGLLLAGSAVANGGFLATDAARAANAALQDGQPAVAVSRLEEVAGDWLGDPAYDSLLLRAAEASGRDDLAGPARGRLTFFAPGHPSLPQPAPASGAAPEDPAAVATALAELEALVDAGSWPRAWLLAVQLAPQWEGEPRFDYLMGQAALHTGHPDEATFAFQRVLASEPENARVRSHLARALYAGGDLDWARREFQSVLTANPPADVRSRVEHYLERIRQRQRARYASIDLRLQPGAGWDSNVNTGTDARLVDTLFGTLPLPTDSREQADSFRRLRASLSARVPLGATHGLDGVLAVDVKDNDDLDRFDTAVALARAGGWYGIAPGNRLTAHLRATLVHLDEDVLRESAGVQFGWQRAGPTWLAELTAGVDVLDFPDDPSRDAREFSLGTAWSSQRAPLGASGQRLSLLGRVNDNQGGADFLAHDALQLGWEGTWSLGVHSARLAVAVQGRRYDDSHPIFLDTREDLGASVRAGWDWQLTRGMVLTTDVGWQVVQSNIDTFDLERALAEAGLRLAL